MSAEEWKNITAGAQSIATIVSFIVAGYWVYRRYVRSEENFPNIEFSADLNFVGTQGAWWIVEVIALIDNKGKVQHRMSEFEFDLNALYLEDPVETSKKWGDQIDFSRRIAAGSFVPAKFSFFFIDPGVKAKYTYVTRVPTQARFLILHCWFNYSDKRKYGHTAEITVKVPSESIKASTGSDGAVGTHTTYENGIS